MILHPICGDPSIARIAKRREFLGTMYSGNVDLCRDISGGLSEEISDMIRMIVYTKTIRNILGYSGAGRQIRRKTGYLCSLEQLFPIG